MSLRRPARVVVAVLLASAALLTLAGCRVQPGAAAFVGDHRISEGDVQTYVGDVVPDSSAATPGQLPPRAQVVSTLVVTQVLRDYLTATGGVPTEAELVANRDQAFTTVTGQGAPDLTSLTGTVVKLGFGPQFVDAYVSQVEVEYYVIQRSKAGSLAELGAAVAKKTPSVRVSPRYGAWDPAQLTLAGATSMPAYLQLSTSTGA